MKPKLPRFPVELHDRHVSEKQPWLDAYAELCRQHGLPVVGVQSRSYGHPSRSNDYPFEEVSVLVEPTGTMAEMRDRFEALTGIRAWVSKTYLWEGKQWAYCLSIHSHYNEAANEKPPKKRHTPFYVEKDADLYAIRTVHPVLARCCNMQTIGGREMVGDVFGSNNRANAREICRRLNAAFKGYTGRENDEED